MSIHTYAGMAGVLLELIWLVMHTGLDDHCSASHGNFEAIGGCVVSRPNNQNTIEAETLFPKGVPSLPRKKNASKLKSAF